MGSFQIDVIEDPSEEMFRDNYLNKSKPVVLRGLAGKLKQFQWNFDYLTKKVGHREVSVYDWGEEGPTINDNFVITQMELGKALELCQQVNHTQNQRYSICQLSLDFLPELNEEYTEPGYLQSSDKLDSLPWLLSEDRRRALFISFFRGMHWHNGRHAIAQQITGSKKFFLYDPKDTRYLYPKRFRDAPMSWFDETEAVFCSNIPFEAGIENVNHDEFPLFKKATPYEVELKAGDTLFIPSHWWHYTHASEPCVLITEFWDASLRDWGFPIAYRSYLMKPYRKFLYRRLLKFKTFSRKKPA